MKNFSYYYALKVEARRRTTDALNRRAIREGTIAAWDKLTICSIMGTDIGDALSFAEGRWPQFRSPATHGEFECDWRSLAYKAVNDTDHFDLALWQEIDGEQILVALALGAPSNGRKFMILKWVERYFGPSPVAGRTLWPILTCAEEYARLLGSDRVLIKDPIDPTVYQRYEYETFVHPNVPYGGNYLSKEVSNG